MLDPATLQMLVEAAKKKQPTQTEAIGQGVSAGVQQASRIGQPGRFMKRDANGVLQPVDQGGKVAQAAEAQQKAGMDLKKMRKFLLNKIFKSNPTELGMPVDIRPEEQQRADMGGQFGFGGYY